MTAKAPLDILSELDIDWKLVPLIGSRKDLNLKLDMFKHSISARDGLPPYAQARIIDIISTMLKKARSFPALLVSVDSPGRWFIDEVDRLVKRKIPTLILPSGQSMKDTWDFQPHAIVAVRNEPDYPWEHRPYRMGTFGLSDSQVRILRILARLKTAHTPEITSLAGFSETHVRSLLKKLQSYNLVEWKRIGKYDGWTIKTNGLRLAHRSWKIPKGTHFAPYRREFRYAGERHRRVSRMWRAWLESAYDEIEIWECWTEVSVHYCIPDALAWGTHHGHERLFWLEVDSGHSSKKVMERNYKRRLHDAHVHSKEWGIPIVFCIMGPPWVVEYFPKCIPKLYPNLAVIGHDWRDFGNLSIYEFGQWINDLEHTRHRRRSHSAKELSFDPAQYPPKPKMKTPKIQKPKSEKPKFSVYSDDDYYPTSGELERGE